MQLRRAGLHCLLGIQHKREFLIFHLDRTQRFCRRDLVFSDDGGNIIPIEANAARQKQPVRHILMVRVRRPRVPCRGEFIFRHIKAGHNFNHSLDFFRRARVDGLHHAVCNRGMQHFGNKRIPVTKVVRIARPAGDLVKRIHALFALSNSSVHAGSSFFRNCQIKWMFAAGTILSPLRKVSCVSGNKNNLQPPAAALLSERSLLGAEPSAASGGCSGAEAQ